VHCTFIYRTSGNFDVAIRGHEETDGIWIWRSDVLQQIESIAVSLE